MKLHNKRATVYLQPELHRALRIKAAETEHSISELINEAVRYALLEDATDLAAFDERKAEPVIAFEDVVRDLKNNGKI